MSLAAQPRVYNAPCRYTADSGMSFDHYAAERGIYEETKRRVLASRVEREAAAKAKLVEAGDKFRRLLTKYKCCARQWSDLSNSECR